VITSNKCYPNGNNQSSVVTTRHTVLKQADVAQLSHTLYAVATSEHFLTPAFSTYDTSTHARGDMREYVRTYVVNAYMST